MSADNKLTRATPASNPSRSKSHSRSCASRNNSASAAAPKSKPSSRPKSRPKSGQGTKSPPAPPQTESTPSPIKKPRRPRKPMGMGEALRRQGLDEHELAGNWVHVVETLKGVRSKSGGIEKLLVDVLKECTRQLEAESQRRADSSGSAPVIVQLIHKVERPPRPAALPALPPPAIDIAPAAELTAPATSDDRAPK
jgi:hypothetical protein